MTHVGCVAQGVDKTNEALYGNRPVFVFVILSWFPAMCLIVMAKVRNGGKDEKNHVLNNVCFDWKIADG